MPDEPLPGSGEVARPRSNRAALLAAVAEAVLAVPGVVRLEPTLSTAGPGVLLHRSPADGIRLLDRAGVVDIDVNLATTAACQAREVTHRVRADLAALLPAHGYTTGSVAVSVLAIDPASPPNGSR